MRAIPRGLRLSFPGTVIPTGPPLGICRGNRQIPLYPFGGSAAAARAQEWD